MSTATFGNILIAHGAYCSSECFVVDCIAGMECHKANGTKHAFAECHCSAVDPTIPVK